MTPEERMSERFIKVRKSTSKGAHLILKTKTERSHQRTPQRRSIPHSMFFQRAHLRERHVPALTYYRLMCSWRSCCGRENVVASKPMTPRKLLFIMRLQVSLYTVLQFFSLSATRAPSFVLLIADHIYPRRAANRLWLVQVLLQSIYTIWACHVGK